MLVSIWGWCKFKVFVLIKHAVWRPDYVPKHSRNNYLTLHMQLLRERFCWKNTFNSISDQLKLFHFIAVANSCSKVSWLVIGLAWLKWLTERCLDYVGNSENKKIQEILVMVSKFQCSWVCTSPRISHPSDINVLQQNSKWSNQETRNNFLLHLYTGSVYILHCAVCREHVFWSNS
jgi:hypothetical protein